MDAGDDLQEVVFAINWKGEFTWAPLTGAVTLMADVDVVGPTTVMLTTTSSCACLPQHFTCTRCGPAEADIMALNDVETIVAGLLSIE